MGSIRTRGPGSRAATRSGGPRTLRPTRRPPTGCAPTAPAQPAPPTPSGATTRPARRAAWPSRRDRCRARGRRPPAARAEDQDRERDGPRDGEPQHRRRRAVEEAGERAEDRLVVGQLRWADASRVEETVRPVRRRGPGIATNPTATVAAKAGNRPSGSRTTSDQHQQHDEHERRQLHACRDADEHAGPAPHRPAPGRPAPRASGTC